MDEADTTGCSTSGCPGTPVATVWVNTPYGGLETFGTPCEWHLLGWFSNPGKGPTLRFMTLEPLEGAPLWLPPGATDPDDVYGPDWSEAVWRGKGFPPADDTWRPIRPYPKPAAWPRWLGRGIAVVVCGAYGAWAVWTIVGVGAGLDGICRP